MMEAVLAASIGFEKLPSSVKWKGNHERGARWIHDLMTCKSCIALETE